MEIAKIVVPDVVVNGMAEAGTLTVHVAMYAIMYMITDAIMDVITDVAVMMILVPVIPIYQGHLKPVGVRYLKSNISKRFRKSNDLQEPF